MINELRLAQAQAQADAGMSEDEYRFMVERSTRRCGRPRWRSPRAASRVSEASGDMYDKAAEEMEKARRAAKAASPRRAPDAAGETAEDADESMEKSAEEMRKQAEEARESTTGDRRAEGQHRALPQVRGRHQEVRDGRPGVDRAVSADLGRVILDEARERLVKGLPAQVMACLDLLDDGQIWWRANEGSNSIGNLVLHVCGSSRHFVGRALGGRTTCATVPRSSRPAAPYRRTT